MFGHRNTINLAPFELGGQISALLSVNIASTDAAVRDLGTCLKLPGTAHRPLDLVGKAVEVLVQTLEYLALCLIRGQVADQRGLCGILAKFFDGRSVILHGRGLLLPGQQGFQSHWGLKSR